MMVFFGLVYSVAPLKIFLPTTLSEFVITHLTHNGSVCMSFVRLLSHHNE